MQVEETGLESQIDGDETQKEQRMIEFIERRKVVMLEDVAAEFKMLTKEVVSKIEQLERSGRLSGITDDRGKYIHITKSEFASITEYIISNGRVNRSDLFKEANKLVRMTPTKQDREIMKQEQMDVLSKVEQTIGTDKK